MNKRAGFTLIELLVVVVIVAVLGMIGLTSYRSVNERSRNARRLADVEQIRAAFEMYRADNGNYPRRVSEDGGWEVSWDDDFLEKLQAGGDYISGVPMDPINNSTYFYRYARCDSSLDFPVDPNHQFDYKIQVRLENTSDGLTCPACAYGNGDTGGQYGADFWHCVTNPL